MFLLRASSRLRHHKSKHLDARDSNTPLWYAVPAVTATEELTYSKESPGLGCWNQNRVTLNRNAFDDVAGDFAVASVIEAGGSGVGVAGEGLHICEWDPLMQQIGNRADSERMGREGGW